MCIKLIQGVSFLLLKSFGKQACSCTLWARGDRFIPYLCLIVLSIKFITISPLWRPLRWLLKPEWNFSVKAGQVLVNMLERKRNYTEVSHQTLTTWFKANRRRERNVCVCLKKNLMLKHGHTHTHTKLPPDPSVVVRCCSLYRPSLLLMNEWKTMAGPL